MMANEKRAQSRATQQASAKHSGKRKRKKGIPRFYLIYFSVLIVCIAGLCWGSASLRKYLAAYESVQPKYEAEKAAQVFLSRDFDTLYQYEETGDFGGETQEQYVAYLNRLTSGMEITYAEASALQENTKRYVVKAGSHTLGEFTLRREETAGDYGLYGWTLDGMKTTNVLQKQEYTITAPANSTVYVDGKPLGEESIIEKDIPLFEVSNLPEGASVPVQNVYRFSRYFGVQSVRVIDQYGAENPLEVDGVTCVAQFNYDDVRLRSKVEERVIQVVRRLSCFMTEDYPRKSLYEDLVKNSRAYEYVRGYDTDWIAKHRGYEFHDMQVCNYVSYSDTCFSAEASFDYHVTYYNTDPEIYPTAYRLFFQKVDGEWLLYDFTLI